MRQTDVILLWILFTYLLVPYADVEGKSGCVSTEKCVCYDSFDYEYQCPPNQWNVLLHTKPGQYLKIDCEDLIEYDINLFPNVSLGDVTDFRIRYCPLPGDSFKPTMDLFNISRFEDMTLDGVNINNSTGKKVTKQLFDGLSELKTLYFSSLVPINLESDFLENLPNLRQLQLQNTIDKIYLNMFNYTPKLEILHLSQNLISELPNRVFQNLPDLRMLHLWNNQLTSLENETFAGLGQLTSLELSNNQIVHLDDDTFSDLVHLVNISLRRNKLKNIGASIFRNNGALQFVRMGYNPHLNLSDYVFAGLMNLTDINIDSSNLETLPEHLFEGSVNLKSISLRTNIIKDLPDNIFEGLTKLEKLYLDENNLSKLPDRIFSSLKNLVELNLKGNSLTEINENMFAYTSKLKKLNLSNNKIANINNRAFLASTKLESLDLSYNQYKIVSPIVDINPFNPLNDLQSLNLSHNLIDDFPESIVPMLKLTSFDLNYNVIRYVRVASLLNLAGKLEIFLNHNNISVVDFSLMDAYVGASGDTDDDSHSTVVYISQNPIRCDCDNFMLTQYNYDKLDPIIKTLVDIRMNDLYCATPGFEHILVTQLQPYHVTCALKGTGCPNGCSCEYRPYDKCAVINCRKRNLTQPPALHLNTNQTLENIDVHLEENALQTGPDKGFGYENVTRLYLQNNQITDLDWIPSKIKKLNLSNNQLRNMGAKIMAILNTTEVENITLFGNPWSCDCSALSLQNYLRNHYNKVNINDVKCKNNKLLLDQKELCKTYTSIIYAIAVPILIIICAVAIAVAIYFYYKEQIKVWLYAKNLCLWFVTEEELDKDKTYDIFISYSHKDEDFLIQNLLPVLEAGPNPYKICIHVRDWIPGELIATQVTNSVLDSRRTLVVLSESFLESGWGKLEFRTAHTQAITEGRARVVVIKYGKINEEKLDDELKAYLKSNTYVEWGDPWFWNKLKYALPHYKRNKKYNNNQKHVNMMLKIDDKFELVNSSPTIHAESTPPVISLDPALLKNHPLNFNSTDSIATPPAEAPLMVKK